MTFGDAIQNAKDGKKIRRMSWPEEAYVFLHPTRMFITSHGTQWTPSAVEMLSDNWELCG